MIVTFELNAPVYVYMDVYLFLVTLKLANLGYSAECFSSAMLLFNYSIYVF